MIHDDQDARRDPSDRRVTEAELFEQETTFSEHSCDRFALTSGVIGMGRGKSPARIRGGGQQSELYSSEGLGQRKFRVHRDGP